MPCYYGKKKKRKSGKGIFKTKKRGIDFTKW